MDKDKRFSFGRSNLKKANTRRSKLPPINGSSMGGSIFQKPNLKPISQHGMPSMQPKSGEMPRVKSWDKDKLAQVTTKRMSLEQYKSRDSKLRLSFFGGVSGSKTNQDFLEAWSEESHIEEDVTLDSDDEEEDESWLTNQYRMHCGCAQRLESWYNKQFAKWEELKTANPRIQVAIELALDRLWIIVDLASDIYILTLVRAHRGTHPGL